MREIILSAVIGYFAGCLSLAYLFGRKHGKDLKKTGTGSLGASNTVLALGFKAGAAVAIHDVAKAALAAIAAGLLFPDQPYAAYAAGTAAVVGHVLPFWLKFDGGKGFAPFMGLVLGTDWKAFLIILAVGCLLVFLTDYIVAATFTFIAAYPAYLAVCRPGYVFAAVTCAASLLILSKHVTNIKAIAAGRETSVRKTIKRKNSRE